MMEAVAFIIEILIVGDDGSPFSGIQILGSLEAECTSYTIIADTLSFPLGKMCLAGIFYHREFILGSNLHHHIDIKGRTADMYRH